MRDGEEHAQRALQALREAVAEMMERKRRLGQYVVVWQDGNVVRMIPPAREDAEAQEDGAAGREGRAG